MVSKKDPDENTQWRNCETLTPRLRRLCIRDAALLDQPNRLKLELACELPTLLKHLNSVPSEPGAGHGRLQRDKRPRVGGPIQGTRIRQRARGIADG